MCLPYVNILFGIEPYHLWKNPEDTKAGDVKDDIPYQPGLEQQEKVFEEFVKTVSESEMHSRHVRYAQSCSENSLNTYCGWMENI